MNARLAIAATFALAVIAHASPSDADPADEGGGAVEPLPPVIVAIDFDTIPKGTLPKVPGEADAPGSVSKDERATGIQIQKVQNPFGKKFPKGKKLPKGLLAKIKKTELVELAPAEAAITAMYIPAADGTDFDGESIPRMSCRNEQPPIAVRWETLTLGTDDTAKLEIKDLWFDSPSCSVGSGSTSEVVFKAVAWDGAKPWLFAVRDEKSVTFLMPRSTEASADAMVGPATTVRGGFTRVTLPLGRWGSSSLVATLSGLQLKAPPPPPLPTKSNAKGKTFALAPEAEPSGEPVEIAVELVQTMSEKSPTVLVRRSQPTESSPVEAPPVAALTID
jgi:hypothetical protein